MHGADPLLGRACRSGAVLGVVDVDADLGPRASKLGFAVARQLLLDSGLLGAAVQETTEEADLASRLFRSKLVVWGRKRRGLDRGL